MASLAWLNRVAGGSLRGPLPVGPATGVGQMGAAAKKRAPIKTSCRRVPLVGFI